MSKLLFATAFAALAAFVNTAQASCEEDTLDEVASDGDILVMQSGRVYRVNSGDTLDTQLWLSYEDVLICDGEMINKDERGEKASITQC